MHLDTAGHVLLHANSIYARANSTTSSSSATTATRPPVYKVVGIILAICSGLFIGVSFVLKKTGLLKANKKYNQAAGEGYGYLKNVYWWTGMTLMIIGEICNFVAYAFVDAILVTPLGALSVVVTTILSAIFLKERLSFVGKVGCFNCIVGSVVIVVNAPAQSSASTIEEMQHFVIAPGFLSYAGVVIVGCLFIALWVAPRYGKKSMLVYITICSLIGGLSVTATQGLGAAIVTQIGGTPQFNHWFIYVLLVFVIITLLTEIVYLNKALNLFNAALVTPTYYVCFTSATIVTSAILFQGFHGTVTQILTVVFGFLQICSGVVLLQLSKSSKDVPDSAVFQGDLDQMRTIAEQEEPESEPRADTIRGGGALLRALSRKRTMRQVEEVKAIHNEHMAPIAENEQVEWDGLRRRKTVLGAGHKPLQRTKTIHPPLGMSAFPEDNASIVSSEGDIHPGFFPRFGRSSTRKSSSHAHIRHASPSPVNLSAIPSVISDTSTARDHIYGLPPTLAQDGAADTPDYDTSYKGPGTSIVWDDSVSERERTSSHGSSLHPHAPRPPPHSLHSASRAFSFQNVLPFHRSHSYTSDDGHGHHGPASRAASALSFTRKTTPATGTSGAAATEEERLGLVKGDSSTGTASRSPSQRPGGAGQLAGYDVLDEDDDEWQVENGQRGDSQSPSGAPIIRVGAAGDLGLGGRGRRDAYDDYDSDDDDGGELRRQATGLM